MTSLELQPNEEPKDDLYLATDTSLGSWKIDPETLTPRAKELWLQEIDAPVIITEDRSVRPKILDACGMACVFCHNEGTPVAAEARERESQTHSLGRVSIYAQSNGVAFLPGRMKPDEKFESAITQLRDRVGLEEIHLTGGEPTLHPELPSLIEIAANASLKVKMTSNGENPRSFLAYANAGLESVVFSIFGTTAEELAQVQSNRFQNTHLAERKISLLHQSIESAISSGIRTKANVVVTNFGQESRVSNILKQFGGISLRLLNSLDDGEESYTAIYEILSGLGARPKYTELTAGSSKVSIRYELPDGSDISFKQIRPARFNHVCDDCPVDLAGKCEEGFYGLRLYVDEKGEYLVGVCIQRMDLVSHLDDFINSDLPDRLITYREREKKDMLARIGLRQV